MAGALKESEWKKVSKDNPSATGPGLADALKEYSKTEGKDVDQRLEALEEVVENAEEAKKLSIKSKNKEVTRYLDGVLTEARQEMEGLENEEQDPVDFLDDEEAYKNYLKKVTKKLTKKPMYFAAVLGRKPEEHKIIFHKSHDGKKLLKALKDATDLKKFAWGLAGGHAEQKSTLTLALEGPQIGGIKSKGEKLLKYYKPLAFDTILLMVEGEIVEDLPDPDDVVNEAELAGPTLAGPTPAGPTPAGPTAADATTKARVEPEAPPIDAEMARFTSRLKVLKPEIDAAIADPSANPQIKVHVREIAGLARQKEYAPANALLDVVEQLLRQSSVTRPSSSSDINPADSFKARLAALVPQIKAAAGTPAGDQAKLKASEAVLARKQDLDQANALLGEAEELLKPIPPVQAKKTGDAGPADLFKARLSALIPQIKQAAGTPTGDDAKLKASEAGVFARKGDYPQANLLLDDAERVLQQVPEALPQSSMTDQNDDDVSSIPELSPAFAQRWKDATIDWQEAMDKVSDQLEKLRVALLSVDEEENPDIAHMIPQFKEIASSGLSGVVGGQRVAMQVAIRNIDQAADDAAKANFISDARRIVKKVGAYVASSEEVEVCDDNGFNVEVTIRSQLGGALAMLDEALDAAFAD